jgi:hypothetical protein
MNIAKNMEAIFIATIVLVGATTLATAAVPAHHAAAKSAAAASKNAGAMQVVTISAKRLTAAEKAAL